IPTTTQPVQTEIVLKRIINTYIPKLKNETFPHNLFRLLRHLQNARIVTDWHCSNRIQRWNVPPEEIDWQITYSNINYHNKALAVKTHPKQSDIRAFKLKLILNELPTFENLHIRHKDKYNNGLCKRCQMEDETTIHMLTCKNTTIPIGICTKKTTISRMTKQESEQRNPTVYFNHHLTKKIQKKIWLPRCLEVHKKEDYGKASGNKDANNGT
ncbi:24989_t:CDS:2, partial [Gigaspora rosea]